MTGTPDQAVLPRLLGDIYLGRKSGFLELARGEDRLGLFFREGKIVRVENGNDGPTPSLPKPDDTLSLRLDRVLKMLGIVAAGHPQKATTRDGVLSALGWADPAPAFEEREPEAAPDPVLNLSTEEMILEAVRRQGDPERVREALGDLEWIPALRGNPLSGDAVTPTDAYLLSRVDGSLSAREVIGLIPLDPNEVERSLLGLILTGVVELKPRPPKAEAPAKAQPASPQPPADSVAPPAEARPAASARARDAEALRSLEERRREILEAYEGLRTRSHFEILGIPEAASDAQVKEAYFRLARRFHPDVHQDTDLEDLKDKLEAVFMRLGGAYEVLRNPASRTSYLATLRRRRSLEAPRRAAATPAAFPPTGVAVPLENEPHLLETAENLWMSEEAIHRAERLVADGKVWDAIQLLQVAIPRMYGRKQKEKGRVLLARAYIKNPNWVKRGEELLQSVIQEDPGNGDAHYVLGTLYKESGMNSRAITMFRKALELSPGHKAAQSELSSLSSTALIRKLFGRG